jgi:hypothetical protein
MAKSLFWFASLFVIVSLACSSSAAVPTQTVPMDQGQLKTSSPTKAVNTPKPTNTSQPTNKPKPTNTPLPTYTPYPTSTPMPTYTPYPSYTPVPTNTPVPPTLTPLPTYTPYPTYTPFLTTTPEGITFSSLSKSTSKIYYGGCGTSTVEFTLTTTGDTSNHYIYLFFHLKDKDSSATTDWNDGKNVNGNGPNTWKVTFDANNDLSLMPYNNAWLIYQFVLQAKDGSHINGPSYGDITVSKCSP